MHRLFHQFYLTLIASLVLVTVGAGLIWRFLSDGPHGENAYQVAASVISSSLPGAGSPLDAQRQALLQLAARIKTDLALYGANRELIAAAGRPLPPPDELHRGGRLHGWRGPAWGIKLADGRWLVMRAHPQNRHPALRILLFISAVAVAVALGAYPVTRRLTRRIERLQSGVDTLGGGDLSARVKVEGSDEVARLARSFNQAAARIEELVSAHKLLLANASHELRTPLSRIRLGVELIKETADPKRKAELENDIAELDQLLDEILLASRLDAVTQLDVIEEVDFLALAAEECARFDDCSLSGEQAMVRGDPKLLRRMIRNLLENAKRHGAPPIDVELRCTDQRVTLSVCDKGLGIPEEERERVFSPFCRVALGRRRSGAGLGLALVRQIARRHGGQASIEPRDEWPSCFQVSLPAAPAEPSPRRARSASSH
jgi:signal transduction histidine kinase